DSAKAIELYWKAIKAGGTSDAAREAWLRIARLYEQTGKPDDARRAWTSLTEQFADKLTDAEKKEVHEGLGRVLKPGERARSPLGEVFVRPVGAAAGET